MSENLNTPNPTPIRICHLNAEWIRTDKGLLCFYLKDRLLGFVIPFSNTFEAKAVRSGCEQCIKEEPCGLFNNEHDAMRAVEIFYILK